MDLDERINRLIRGNKEDLNAYLDCFESHTTLSDTELESHTYYLRRDPNGRPKCRAFTEALADYALEYAVPRERLRAAHPDNHRNSSAELMRLTREAKKAFNELEKSGEGGELLLYALAEKVLGLPQLLCKMDIKTSSKMHYHGADGVHVGVNNSGHLALYWGESKVHKKVGKALAECFESLERFMHADSLLGDSAFNDFHLIFRNPNLTEDDPSLGNAILSYFDPRGDNAWNFETRAIALVGFNELDSDNSGFKPENIHAELENRINSWKRSLAYYVKKSKLERFVMHIFLVPFPSIDAFRSDMLKSLDIK